MPILRFLKINSNILISISEFKEFHLSSYEKILSPTGFTNYLELKKHRIIQLETKIGRSSVLT